MKRLVATLTIVIIAIIVGYFASNLFHLSVTDKIYVGQMAMEDPYTVVGRDDSFPSSASPTVDAQLLLSMSHRSKDNLGVAQELIVKDREGNEVFSKELITEHYSTVVSLHPLQQTKGVYVLEWYWDGERVATKRIVIE